MQVPRLPLCFTSVAVMDDLMTTFSYQFSRPYRNLSSSNWLPLTLDGESEKRGHAAYSTKLGQKPLSVQPY